MDTKKLSENMRSGIPHRMDEVKKMAKEMMTRATENRVALEGCVLPHRFLPLTDGTGEYRCAKCGGLVTSVQGYWYTLAQSHGGLCG